MKKLRVLSLVLVLMMLFSALPIQVFAEVNAIDIQNEQLFKEELRKAVDEKIYPNGMFEFLSSRMNTSEDLSYVEFAIVRKGGVAGKASVTFKAIDVSAKYGEDYTISVPKGLFTQTLPKNEEAKTLIESFENTVSNSVYSEDSETVSSTTYSVNTGVQYQELPGLNQTTVKQDSGLQQARNEFTGTMSQRKNWREVDQETKDSTLKEHRELYEGIPGVTYTFNFEDGEYIKKIRFNTINDSISEDEEQVMFALLDSKVGVLGELVNGFMNIQDNEAKERVEFEIVENQIEADRGTGYAEVTVKRTAGFYRYGVIQIGTAAISAQPEIDYEPISTELTFVPGQETQKVRVPLLNTLNSNNLQFYIKLDPESPNLSSSGKIRSLVTIKEPAKYLMMKSSSESSLLSTSAELLSSTSSQVKVLLKSVEDDKDANITPKTWTSATSSVDSPAEFIGSICFGWYQGVTEKYFSTDKNADYIYFLPQYANESIDNSKVYLWGFKIERLGGLAGSPYYYVPSEYLDLYSLSANLLEDVNGKKIPYKEVLMGNTISILPVFKARTSFLVINNDQTKGDIAPGTFNSGEAVRIGMLDTVNIRVSPKNGYSISGYKHANINIVSYLEGLISEYKYEIFPFLEKTLLTVNLNDVYDFTKWFKPYDNTNYDPRYDYYRPNFIPIQGININPSIPGEIDFKPQKNLSVFHVEYSPSTLKVKVDPNSGNMNKGSVAYFPEGGNPQTGDMNNPMIISPIDRNKTYTFSGSPDEGYRILWKDWSGDVDEDGILDEIESKIIEKYEHLFDRKAVSGNFFNYVSNYDKPLIYYSFEPKTNNTVPGTITGKVYLSGGTVLQNTATLSASTTKKPLEDVTVIINGHTVSTDSNGKFYLKHNDFTTNEYHTIVINYKGTNYTGYVNVNAFTNITIEEYDSFVPYGLTVFQGGSKIELNKIDNRDANNRFNFYVKAVKPGITAKKALIRIYSKDKVQRGEAIEVSASNSAFTFDFNPAEYNVLAGDSMTIQIVDQNNVEYTEHEVGFIFKKYLNTFSLLNSFKSPAKPAIDLVGTVDAAFDLGLAGKKDKYVEDDGKKYIIRFGFSDSWKKSLSDDSKVEEDKSAKEALKDAAKDPEDGESEAEKEKAVTSTAGNAVDKEKAKKNSASVTSDMEFGLSTALYLCMTLNDDKSSPEYGNFYFNEMILSVTLSGKYQKTVERMTPIGVTVYVEFVLKGEITAMLVTEQYQGKKFYFDGNGEIDFSKSDRDDPYRNFTMYGKFIIKPTISITAGAKIAGADLSITGDATFNLDFTSSGSSTGSVTLTSHIKLKALFFTYNWDIYEKTWSLYSKGVASNQLLGDANYMYGSAENYEVILRDYLKNRGIWQGNGSNMLLRSSSLGTTAENEQILQTGVYPHPDTLLATIGENQQLLVFLDDAVTHDERNRTQLYYSIYDGSSWSVPQKVDNDNTPDGLPWIEDIGDKVLVAWSSSVTAIESDDTVMEALNNRNIKARFFSKTSKAFGEVQEVTHETIEDQYSDSDPYIAYWKDEVGNEDLMITYTKSHYKASGSTDNQDAVIGDVINPYYSTLAYRFYDFNTNSWDVSDDKGNGYYGQGFITVSDYVYADDSDFVISGDDTWNGYWSRIPNSSEVGIRTLPGSDPLIADSNLIGYKDYAVLAYELDLDTNIGTTEDRELFIQLYSYKNKMFYTPIRCTYNTIGEYDLEFEEVNDSVYLYYISDGDIMSMDIGKLIQEGLLNYEVGGKSVFLINKLPGVYNMPETVVHHPYDSRTDEFGNEIRENESPIDEFMVKADKNNVYIVWGESDITYKEGINQNSKEATLPENHYREHHIYAARQIISSEASVWSDPVKLTEGKGANYKDLDFEILPNGNLRTVFVKRFSEVTDVAGKLMSVENMNNSTLMTADFDVNKLAAEVKIDQIPMPEPFERLPVGINVHNLSLSPMNGIILEVYQLTGDTVEKINEQALNLRGGEEKNISLLWQAPLNPENTKLQAVIKNGEELLNSDEQSIIAKSIIDVIDAKVVFDGRNRLKITGIAENNGNIAASVSKIIAEVSGVDISTVEIGSLEVGKIGGFEFYADIQPGMFKNIVGDDGSVTEYIDITVHSESGTGTSIRTERYASQQDIEAINNINTFELKNNGVIIPSITYLTIGKTMNIEPYLTYNNETIPKPRLVYVSDDYEIADFSQGFMKLLGKKTGQTTITAYALPQINELVLSKDSFKRVENLITLSESAVKVKSFVVNVVPKTSSGTPVYISEPENNTNVTTTGDATTVSTTVKAVADSTGKVEATITSSQISSAISKITEGLSKLGQPGNANVEIKIDSPVAAKSIDTKIPVTALKEVVSSQIKALKISTPAAEISFSNKSLSSIISQAAEDVKITVSKVDNKTLADNIRNTVGTRPVLDFNVTSGDRRITQFNDNVEVTVPYTPGENEDINAIVVYYISDNGSLNIVSNCLYNPETGMVTFSTNHFSQYAIGYNKVSFKDVSEKAWYADAVGFIAARGITTGTGKGNYSPDDMITRGQFMVMMLRTYGIEPDENAVDNFNDSGNEYYSGYLATAKRLGISKGTGDNMFSPAKLLTRQEMVTLIYNTLKVLDKLPKDKVEKSLADFNDADNIAPWANDAMVMLVKKGIISGYEGRLNPTSDFDRAQMAQVLYNLLSK